MGVGRGGFEQKSFGQGVEQEMELVPLNLNCGQRRDDVIDIRSGGDIASQGLVPVVETAPAAGFRADVLPGFNVPAAITGKIRSRLTKDYLLHVENNFRKAQ